jgi:hypothetical protein
MGATTFEESELLLLSFVDSNGAVATGSDSVCNRYKAI